jgi:hypothetical protein
MIPSLESIRGYVCHRQNRDRGTSEKTASALSLRNEIDGIDGRERWANYAAGGNPVRK